MVEALTLLAEGKVDQVGLGELGATFSGLDSITLIAGTMDHVLLQDGVCEWSCTRDSWDPNIDLLFALHRSGHGFQYMAPDSAAGLFVELWYDGPSDPRAGWGRFRDDELPTR